MGRPKKAKEESGHPTIEELRDRIIIPDQGYTAEYLADSAEQVSILPEHKWALLCALASNPQVYKGSANDAATIVKLMAQIDAEWDKFWEDELP